jgi:two-component system, OmpR family, copper resistance phosphate regulon response regulator CusR
MRDAGHAEISPTALDSARMQRILIVEDEPKTAAYLEKGLAESGYVATVARSGDDGLRIALNRECDLVLLDVMLPGRDGWSVIQSIRDRISDLPVIFLTARDSVEDRVKGLELQADDYLVKPFAFSELLARIRTVLRRGRRGPEMLQIANLEIDQERHRASRGGQLLNLTPKEFLLLALLVRRTGEVLSRAVIAKQVWDIDFDTDTNIIDVAVRRLRAKVDDPFEQKLIHTVRGMGYVLETR